MPPKAKKFEEPSPDQGELLQIAFGRDQVAEVTGVAPEGIYAEDLPKEDPNKEFHDKVHEAVVAEQKTRRRREAQLGKHSPLERDGRYAAVRAGDVLPGFGIVTYKNLGIAIAYGRELDAQREEEASKQPWLLTADIHKVVAEVADNLDIRHGLVGTAAVKGASEAEKLVVADTQIKLEGLRDDDRAGFLPTTHREKSQAYELLDYMEPGKYEKGVSTRLDEIFFRQQREMKKAGMTPREAYEVAIDSVRSVVREWGDYLADAQNSWVKLDNLGKLIEETPNPRLTVKELLEDEAQGEVITQLVRYAVLRKQRDETKEPRGFDPLWVRENRTNPTDEKHKTVEDVFTHQNEEFMAAYVQRRAEQMSVGQVRSIVLEAKRDQALRGKFWRRVLESVNEDYQQFSKLALGQNA